MSALKFLLNGLAILVAISAPSSANEQRVINEQFHISAYYPDSWSEITPGVPNEIFRLWSSHGKGTGGCTIAANDTKIRANTDESIVEVYELVPRVMEARLLQGFTEPKVLDHKITTLSNLKAISIIADGTYSTIGTTVRMRQWSVITQKTGVIYTVTCADIDTKFEDSLPTFRRIMSSFLIFP
jgi:hypothetical protein